MLLIMVYGIFLMLPFNSALINCRLACRRCGENTAYPEMLEVYCEMCGECRSRRRLQGKRNLRTDNDNQPMKDELDGYPDDCVPQDEDPCEEPSLLSQTVTTTSTTTTTTTTQRPCSPKPHCVKPTRASCYPMPCPAVPLAIPVCQMCPMAGSVATAPNPSGTLPHEKKLLNSVTTTTESVFFYVGVPKKLLKDLKLLNK